MQSGSLKEFLLGKYIICACEGIAEESIIDLLLDNDKLCFKREDLVQKTCTRIRTGNKIASEFLNQEYDKDIVILRILDRDNEKFKLPKVYRQNSRIIPFNIVTKPEIEILHIMAESLMNDFEHKRKHQKKLKPSEYYQSHFSNLNVKSKEFIVQRYANNLDELVGAILSYRNKVHQDNHYLSELLAQ